MKTINKSTENNVWNSLVNRGVSEKLIKILNTKFKEIQTKIDFPMENPTLGDIFEVYVASLVSGSSVELANEKFIVKGKADGGIDIIYFAPGTTFFVQVKFEEYEDVFIRKMMNSFDDCFIGKRKHDKSKCFNKTNEDLKEFVYEYQEKHRKTKTKFVFVGLTGKDRDSLSQKFPQKDVMAFSVLDFLRTMDSNVFNNIVEEKEFTITFDHALNPVVDVEEDDAEDIFALVNGEEFISQFIQLNEMSFDKLFHQNIRNKVVNKSFRDEFRETILAEPNNFQRFNNGITITAKSMERNKQNGYVVVKGPQVVNGQQTLRTLVELYKEGLDLSSINIPLRAMEIDDNELAIRIARFSNNQTAVKKAELYFTGQDYAQLVNLSKEKGFVLKGKKGKTNSEEIMTHILSEGLLSFNELVRSHSSYIYPKEYLGSSKSSISTVVKRYFESENKMKSLKKRNNFESALNAVKEYNSFFIAKEKALKLENKSLGAKDKYKAVNNSLKPYKFGISVFYNLTQNKIEDPQEIILNLYNGPAKHEINLFKNNTDINEALKEELNK